MRVALGYTGYLHALAYARERPQGRPIAAARIRVAAGADPPHGDVRRMLLAQKCWVEGGLALVLYCARLVRRGALRAGSAGSARCICCSNC